MSNVLYIHHLENKAVAYLNPDTNTLSICIRDQWGFSSAVILSYEEATKLKELCEKFINRADKNYEAFQ